MYSLDGIVKATEELNRILNTNRLPQLAACKSSLDTLLQQLPGIKLVRDSLHHQEDRGLLKDRKKQKITPKPVDIPHHVKGNVIIHNSMAGDSVVTLTESGDTSEVPVNRSSLDAARDHVQRVIDALPWKAGYPDYEPG